jgi:integrase
MARTVNDAKLDSRTARDRLKAGRRYWLSLDQGLHLGYRRGPQGGKWLARFYIGAQAYEVMTLPGVADDHGDADGLTIVSFRQAQALARKLHSERAHRAAGKPMPGVVYTVARALEDFCLDLERRGKPSAATRTRAASMIAPQLGRIACEKLTKGDIDRWMHEVAEAPPRVRNAKGKEPNFREIDPGDPEARRSRRATANRTLTILRAALNAAWRDGRIASNSAWARVQPFRGADLPRVRYLEVEEAQRLVRACGESNFGALVKAALFTGCRYGELGRLKVEDYKAGIGKLHIRISKSGKGRHIALNDEGIAFFEQATAGKTADALIFTNAGRAWGHSHQWRPMREACDRAKIKPAVAFHILRHTFASHLVMGGASLQVVANAMGHSTTAMTQRHYAHLSPSYEDEQIRAALPAFGFAPAKVAPIRRHRRPA